MFSRLLNRTPRWRNPLPAERLIAIGELSPESDELVSLFGDRDEPVQLAALQKSTRIVAIAESLGSSPGLTSVIRQRILELLPSASDEDQQTAMSHIDDEAFFVELALAGTTTPLRQRASMRVHSVSQMRMLSEKLRAKDQGVARSLADRVSAIESEMGRDDEARVICESLAGLLEHQGSILSSVIELDRRYAALAPNPPFEEVFKTTRSLIQTRFAAENEQRRTRMEWKRSLDSFLHASQAPDLNEASVDDLKAQLSALKQPASVDPELAKLLDESGADHVISSLTDTLQARQKADVFLASAEQMIESGTGLSALESEWKAIAQSGREGYRDQRFAEILDAHNKKLGAAHLVSAETQNESRQRLHALLAQAEQALSEGRIQDAAHARDQLKSLRGQSGELPKPTNQRLGRLSQQLGDLLRWQAFGNATQREEMCIEAETLPQKLLKVGELAKAVQALRDQWKQLDQTQAPAPRALWDRFNAACEIAYAPAAEHFTKLANERKDALSRRDEAIKNASDYVALALTPVGDNEAQQPDWKALSTWLSQREAEWRTMGHVDRKKADALEAKWRDTIQPLKQAISGQYGVELAERERLVGSVLALVSDGQLATHAVAKTKEAQSAWQQRAKSHPLPRKQEQALWEKFRSACNAVFDALGKAKEVRAGAMSTAQSAKNKLIEEYRALSQSTDEKAIRLAITDAPKRWATLGDPGRDADRALSDQFDRALKTLRSGLKGIQDNRTQQQMSQLMAVFEVCEAWDDHALRGQSPEASVWNEKWEQLRSLPPVWKQKMLLRRQAAEQVISAGGPAIEKFAAKLGKEHAKRLEQLVDLELELGLNGGGQSAAERMKRQVARLADRMKTGSTQRSPLDQLVEICATSGKGDMEYAKRLNAVIESISSRGTDRSAQR